MSLPDPAAAPAPLVDEEARAAAARDLTRNYCVEAGAGTGKTTLLVERLLSIIGGGRARMAEIAAITFTEKAAGELKLRLRQELQRRRDLAPADPLAAAMARRFAAALAEFDQAAISTIHSFAASLLRERPVEARVDPSFQAIDELDDALLFDQVWDRWLADQLDAPAAAGAAAESAAAALLRALRLGLRLHQVRAVARLRAQNADLVPGPAPPPPDLARFVAALRGAAAELGELLPHCREESDQAYRDALAIVEASRRLPAMDPGRREEFLLRELALGSHGSMQNWRPKESGRRAKELRDALRADLAALQAAIKADAVHQLCLALGQFVAALDEARAAQGKLNFADLLLKAREMLRVDREARGYFQRRYAYILVDEFQDTDPLQVEIVFFLAEAEPRADRWEEAELAPGKLFIVGDPKQSIYRFRRADIETYGAARRRLEQTGGQTLPIVQNFRAVPGLVEWVNDVFAPLMQRPADGDYQPDYQPLHAFRPELERPPVTLVPPPRDCDPAALRADARRRLEAATVAALVRRIVADGWPVHDRQGGRPRPARFGDIALLFPVSTGIDRFEEALRRAGVPHRVEGGKEFYRRQETVDLARLLRAIDNPYDTLSVAAALRSTLFGCSDQDLLDWVACGGSFCYLEPAPEGAAAARVRAGLAEMAALHRRRNEMSLSALVGEAVARTRAVEFALLQGDLRAAGNLRKVAEQARALAGAAGMNLRRFATWLLERHADEVDEPDAPAPAAEGEAVQLLTVHKAKGLEFPIVVLCNAGTSRQNRVDFLVDRRRGTFELKVGDKDGGFATPGYREALPHEERRQVAEDKRLFYVAATRARDHLVIPAFGERQAKGFLQYLRAAAGAGEEGGAPGPAGRGVSLFPTDELELDADAVAASPPTPVPTPPQAPEGAAEAFWAARERWDAERRAALAQAAAELRIRTPSGAHPAEWDDAARTEDHGRWEGRHPVPPGGAAAFGSAFHAALQRLDLRRPPDLAAIRDAVLPAAVREGVEDCAGELARLVEATLRLPVFDRVRSARRVLREVPFAVATRDGLLEGRIDLLADEGDGYLILDFKTDRVEGGELEERFAFYREQGEAYAEAVRLATGGPVKEVAFVFARCGEVRAFIPEARR